VTIGQFIFAGLDHQPITLRAKSLLVSEVDNMGSGLQDNIFLEMLLNLTDGAQIIATAVRALTRCRDIDGFIDSVRRRSQPAWMTFRRPALFLARSFIAAGAFCLDVGLELTLMNGL
jgi:hypothetical protein